MNAKPNTEFNKAMNDANDWLCYTIANLTLLADHESLDNEMKDALCGMANMVRAAKDLLDEHTPVRSSKP